MMLLMVVNEFRCSIVLLVLLLIFPRGSPFQCLSRAQCRSLRMKASLSDSTRNLSPLLKADVKPVMLDVFCNRDVELSEIEAVGFDMDFTLAQYNTAFDLLAYDGATSKLIDQCGYSPMLKQWLQYKPHTCQRGCLIDKKRGNCVKPDQYSYVTKAEHGLTPLGRHTRKMLYREFAATLRSSPADFYNIDTPFSLVDACLFLQLVDLRDRVVSFDFDVQCHNGDCSVLEHSIRSYALENPQRFQELVMFFQQKSYQQLWNDMRKCIDRCHFDGAIKHTVARDPQRFILSDPNVFAMLEGFRKVGKKTFLLTNSLWDYTHVVMNFLLSGATGNDKSLDWTRYFDLIVVGANKPAFLTDLKTLPLFRISPDNDTLTAMEYLPERQSQWRLLLEQGKIFQGGNYGQLHKLLGISNAERVLYVGDHVFSDILKSKRSLGWRTCLIVPELSHEIDTLHLTKQQRLALMDLRRVQYLLERELDALLLSRLNANSSTSSSSSSSSNNNNDRIAIVEKDDSCAQLEASIELKQTELMAFRSVIRQALNEFEIRFHPKWGSMFKAGFQDSRISQQIRDFACLYTSKASNLAQLAPSRTMHTPRDKMPHDHMMEGLH